MLVGFGASVTTATYSSERFDRLGDLVRTGHGRGAAGDLVWVLRRNGRLHGLDPTDGAVAIEGRVPRGASHMVAHDDALWVACGRNRRLVRVDPHTGRAGAAVELPQQVRCMSVTGNTLLAGCANKLSPRQGWLHTIDLSSQQVVATAELSGQPRAIAADRNAAWIACGRGIDRKGTIDRVDPGGGAATSWWTTSWTVGDLVLTGDTLLASMSLELATPLAADGFSGGN